jgi:hypothetical protein
LPRCAATAACNVTTESPRRDSRRSLAHARRSKLARITRPICDADVDASH